ncbi:DNA-directed RNA polymerase subunit alpha C-terminal domain-containing protein [Planococcus kocurii]|uniref:DNA-directed RNA polymerase subunit alpha C-terminal domain-containing protein n=1 Tax=Planococcus kocurii TaxID=1374 RepID=UPI003CFC9032
MRKRKSKNAFFFLHGLGSTEASIIELATKKSLSHGLTRTRRINIYRGSDKMMFYHYTDSISKLNLSTRLYNALKKNKINTINDLFNCSKEDIFKIRNLGKKSIDELNYIIDELDKYKESIYSQLISREPKQRKFFLGADGNKYNDIPIEELKLSVRAFNCLKAAKINCFSDLLFKSNEELMDIPNLGEKSLSELDELLRNTSLELFSETDKVKYSVSENVSSSIFAFISEKININPAQLFEELMPLCSSYSKSNENIEDPTIFLNDINFIKSLYKSIYIQELFEKYIQTLIKEKAYGCREEYILEKMPNYFNDVEFVEIILDKLLSKNYIEIFTNDNYIAVSQPLNRGLQEILSPKQYEIFSERIKGKTLEEISQIANLTRERVRQIETKILEILNDGDYYFEEDIYSDIYQRYIISSDDFEIAFKNRETYNYLALRYGVKKGQVKDSRISLERILEDKSVPISIKRACEKAIYKDYVKIAKDYVPCTKTDISDYVLKHFATDGITFEEFRELYFSILEDIGKVNDPKLSLMDRGYENKLAASKNTLWKYGKRLRYYNIEVYDFTELLVTLNLNQYNNVEYSTLKFFRLYPEIMKTYDIRDEYELHNLLKKICEKDVYPEINFKRMPQIEFGNADRDSQVMELLFSLAPISNYDFAIEYEREYGTGVSTVLANYMSNFNQYYHDDLYKIDFPNLPDNISEKLKNILTDEFYLLSTVKNIYLKEFPEYDEKLLNPFSLKKLGFKVYSNYIVVDQFNSAAEFFNYLLKKKDILYYNDIIPEMKGIISFTYQLYKLKAEYEIIEFSLNKYINRRKLEQNNISKKMLKNYCADVLKFVGESQYFTLHSLRKEGFSHDLDDLGFEEYFYTSILIEDKTNLSYLRVGGNKLMLSGNFDVRFEEFLESVIYSLETLSIDVYKLTIHLRNHYNININTWKLIKVVENTTMFYDVVSEKIFADYDIYYEGV